MGEDGNERVEKAKYEEEEEEEEDEDEEGNKLSA